ncbi:MAG: thioredoxin domain-containing protein, partial [Planctomycetes bacterium]|nr:thioredoxin domain-containing protein [Planctomycetota bacterium]
QHADNPVDWYPWGPEALEKARRQDKPIFLSIGYSACHWCHVMERESFENPEIADLLNRDFVSIKVDREERPDLDDIYMQATMLYNQGQGGWPMSVFLTPDGKPFFAGTYFPPDSRWGRPGFKDVLIQIARLWGEQRERLVESGDALTDAVRKYTGPAAHAEGIPPATVAETASQLARAFDAVHGGLASGPNKFPPSMAMTLMLREYDRMRRAGQPLTRDATPSPVDALRPSHVKGQPNEALRERVELTLDKMAGGGIYDHLGGGIARYSTDPQWLVPHFEKMLYDQALVSAVYVEACQVTGRQRYAEVARDIFDYVLADLPSVEGGFYSSRDADSEGVEGKYYVWSKAEIMNILGERAGKLSCSYYDVTDEGNWEGHSILNVPREAEIVARLNGVEPAELHRVLAEARGKLLAARSQRVPPHLDDKILTSWNGLMIASLAAGGRALGERKYVEAAGRAADFVLTHMTANGRLLRTYRQGKTHTPGYLDDYAFFVEALLELYAATLEPRWLLEAIRLNDDMVRHFWDDAGGAFFFTADDAERLVVRTKDTHDGAIPAGNSVALMDLVRLADLLDREDLRDKAARTMIALAGSVRQAPLGFDRLLLAVDRFHASATEVVIVGPAASPATRGLIRTANQGYDPHRVVLLLDPTAVGAADLRGRVPLLAGKEQIDGQPAAYVCRNRTCRRPVVTEDDLRGELALR